MDYEKILKRADQSNTTPQIQLKRKYHYRKANDFQISRNRKCASCKMIFNAPWKDCSGKYVCATLGVRKNYDAFIKPDHICDVWKRI